MIKKEDLKLVISAYAEASHCQSQILRTLASDHTNAVVDALYRRVEQLEAMLKCDDKIPESMGELLTSIRRQR